MGTFLLVIQVISQLIPMISGLVQAVEQAFPNTPGTGKLSVLRQTLGAAFDHLGAIGVTFEQVWPTLNAFVDASVAIYNASGLFKHASTAVNAIADDINQVGNAVSAVAQEIALAPITATVGGSQPSGPFALAASLMPGVIS